APGLTNIVALGTGDSANYGLTDSGSIISWNASPVPPGSWTNAVAVSGGVWHTCALNGDGTVSAVVDLNHNVNQANVPSGLTNAISISAAGYHNVGLRADGTVYAWGRNDSGQVNVPNGLANVIAVAAGWSPGSS